MAKVKRKVRAEAEGAYSFHYLSKGGNLGSIHGGNVCVWEIYPHAPRPDIDKDEVGHAKYSPQVLYDSSGACHARFKINLQEDTGRHLGTADKHRARYLTKGSRIYSSFSVSNHVRVESHIKGSGGDKAREYMAQCQRYWEFIVDPEVSPYRHMLKAAGVKVYDMSFNTTKHRVDGSVHGQYWTHFSLLLSEKVRTRWGMVFYNFLIASRMGIDRPEWVKNWCLLQDEYGMDPAAALWMNMRYQVSGSGTAGTKSEATQGRGATFVATQRYHHQVAYNTAELDRFIRGAELVCEYDGALPHNDTVWGKLTGNPLRDTVTTRSTLIRNCRITGPNIGAVNKEISDANEHVLELISVGARRR